MSRKIKKNTIELSKEKKEGMKAEIRAYFFEERDEDIGELASILFLEFIIEKLAPDFYNKGVADAHQYMSHILEDVFSLEK